MAEYYVVIYVRYGTKDLVAFKILHIVCDI